MRTHGASRRSGNSNSSRNSNSAFYTLLDRIQNLNFRPFQMCVLLWMGAKGFGQIRPLGRLHQRGRRPLGGADFLAQMPGSRIDVAVQVRHWQTPVQRRAVDELWGFMLRRGVPLGLIVTNSRFMKSAEKAALDYPGRPIQLVSGRQLCSSMGSLELGLAQVRSKWILDESFFRSVGQLCFSSIMGKTSPHEGSTRALAVRCHLTSLDGEPDHPESQPPSSTVWYALAAVTLAVALLLWLKLGGRP